MNSTTNTKKSILIPNSLKLKNYTSQNFLKPPANINDLPFELVYKICLLSKNPSLFELNKCLYGVTNSNRFKFDYLCFLIDSKRLRKKKGTSRRDRDYNDRDNISFLILEKSSNFGFFNFNFLNYLKTKYSDIESQIISLKFPKPPIKSNNIAFIEYLLINELNPNSNNHYSILKSIKQNNLALIQLLLKFGAELKFKNNLVLRLVCKMNKFQLLKYFLEVDKGLKPCSECLKWSLKNGNKEMTKFLLDLGVVPSLECVNLLD